MVGLVNQGITGRSGATAEFYSITKDNNNYLTVNGGTEARPRNIALLACIKY